jgi:hypothetical protein
VTAGVREGEITSYMYLCCNICRHNTAVIHGLFSLLYDALVNVARVMSIHCKHEDVYLFSLLCIYTLKLLDNNFFILSFMLPYLMVFMSRYNCLGLDIVCV